jgi:hypothetical protein
VVRVALEAVIISQETASVTLVMHEFQCYFCCFSAYPVCMK